MSEMQEIEVPYGDYREVDFEIKDENDTAINLAGKGIRFTVKEALTDEDTSSIITKVYGETDDVIIFDESAGLVKVILWPEDTRLTPGTYYLDLKVYDGSKVYTVTLAKMKVTQVVWRGD